MRRRLLIGTALALALPSVALADTIVSPDIQVEAKAEMRFELAQQQNMPPVPLWYRTPTSSVTQLYSFLASTRYGTSFYNYATNVALAGSGQSWCAVGGYGVSSCNTPSQEPWLPIAGQEPGIDIPEGYSTLVPLVDGYTAPHAGNGTAGVWPATYCTYSAGPPKQELCNFNSAPAGTYYIEGLNLKDTSVTSPTTGDCLWLKVVATTSGVNVVISNDLVGYGEENVSNCDVNNGSFVTVQSGAVANVTVDHIELNGAAPNGTGPLSDGYTNAQSAGMALDTTGALIITNSVILNTDARPLGATLPTTLYLGYDYIEGFIEGTGNAHLNGYQHGEPLESLGSSASSCSTTYDHVVMFSPGTQPPGNSAMIYASTGQNNVGLVGYVCISNSVLIPENTALNHSQAVYYTSNSPPTYLGPGITSAAGVEISYNNYYDVKITNSFVDTVGLGACVVNAGGNATSIDGDLNQTYPHVGSVGYFNITSLTGTIPTPTNGIDPNGQQMTISNVPGMSTGTQLNPCGVGCPGTPGTGGVGVYSTNNISQAMPLSAKGKAQPSPVNGTLLPTAVSGTPGSGAPTSSFYSLNTGKQVFYGAVQNAAGCQ